MGVVCGKGLGAAPIAFAVAWAAAAPWPPVRAVAAALALGAIGYGLSLWFYVRATRTLGAARTGVLFAVAPFVGAALAIPIAGESPSLRVAGAAAFIAAGVALLLTERHAHRHRHEPLDHEHLHTHDEHHQHPHRGDEGPEPHSHLHHHD